MIALLIAGGVAADRLAGRHPLHDRVPPQRIGRGQPILGKEDRGPEHQHKEGTPTMGGIAIVGAAVRRLRASPTSARRGASPTRR